MSSVHFKNNIQYLDQVLKKETMDKIYYTMEKSNFLYQYASENEMHKYDLINDSFIRSIVLFVLSAGHKEYRKDVTYQISKDNKFINIIDIVIAKNLYNTNKDILYEIYKDFKYFLHYIKDFDFLDIGKFYIENDDIYFTRYSFEKHKKR